MIRTFNEIKRRSGGGPNADNRASNTRRQNELARAQTPQVFGNRPQPPAYILSNPEAISLWDQIIDGLERIRVLLASDQHLIELYVQAAVRKREAEALLTDPDTGQLILLYRTPPSGSFALNPLLGIISNSEKIMFSCLRELGLTPQSRAKVSVSSDSDADQLATFLDAS